MTSEYLREYKGYCVICTAETKEFKNRASYFEWLVNGACQDCQDTIWKEKGKASWRDKKEST